MNSVVGLVPDQHLCGPTGALHAGYVAGLTARGTGATVTLLRSLAAGQGVVMRGSDLLANAGHRVWLPVATSKPLSRGELDVVPQALPNLADVLAAEPLPPAPGCPVCGPRLMKGSIGLRLGTLGGGRVTVGLWTPQGTPPEDRRRIGTEIVWAVLSCACAAAVRHVLPPDIHATPGRLVGHVWAPIAARRPHLVAAWPDPGTGPLRSTAVLIDPWDRVIGVLRQTARNRMARPGTVAA